MELEPITRQEKIIAGKDLEPVTRMEMFLKQYGGGGGGGGSVPKPLTYDYMPEGYPKKAMGTVTLMEEQELAFASEGSAGQYTAYPTEALELAVGQTYTVSWDGTEYECVCYAFNSIPMLGNLSIFGVGDNTGEPFLYVSTGKSFITLGTAASHTISVKTVGEVITPIDERYLPTIPADKLPTIPAIEFTTAISDSIANDAQPSFTVSNLSYSEIYALVEKGNVQIKDTGGNNYRPIRCRVVESSGSIFVDILVIATGVTIYATLFCSANQTTFYRNNWWQIEATQK